MKPHCLFLMDRQYFPLLFASADLQRLQELVHVAAEPLNADGLSRTEAAALARIELIIGSWGMPALDTPLLDRLPNLRVLFYAAGTVKTIVTDDSWRRQIRVTSAAAANALPTAEYAVAAIVLSLKRMWESVHATRTGLAFDRFDHSIAGGYQSTVGLLGLGKVGRLVAERLQALEVRVIAHDPLCPPADARALGVTLCPLHEIFASSDVVSCHLPHIAATERLLGTEHFRSMRPRTTFINTARGAVVREDELIATLTARPDLYAILDVAEREPTEPDHPLLQLPNVVLTPHIAGSIGLECRRLGAMMVAEVQRYLAGAPLQGEVFRDQLQHSA